MPTQPEHRDVPRRALQMTLGPCEFGQADGKGQAGVPVTLKARDGGVVDHWYWGRVVHDLAGMRLHKKSLAIDYCHDVDQVLGVAEQFDTDSGDLIILGRVLPFVDGDRANEVVAKQQAGVPYEASIAWDGPLRIEEVDAGVTVEVNGRTIDGPVTVIREWSLRGVAICPYGADRNTSTQFAADTEVAVTILSGDSMSKDQDKSDPKAALKQFTDAFGLEKGSQWYLDDKTFEDATVLHQTGLAEDNAKLSAEVVELKKDNAAVAAKLVEFEAGAKELTTKVDTLTAERDKAADDAKKFAARLKALDRGELDALDFASSDGDDTAAAAGTAGRFAHLGQNLGAFAAGMKLPGRNDQG